MVNPKISIITPSYNQGNFIEECIISVLNQNYSNFEHIIIDGGSSDNTLIVLRNYPHLIWISEKDRGQSDALNKALMIVKGEIVGWLNTDDYYLPNAFNIIVKSFRENLNSMWLAGNLVFKIEESNKFKFWPSVNLNYNNLKKNCDILRTQATFIKKSVYDEIGFFNINLNMTMDYDMWLRIAKFHTPINITDNLVVFRIHESQKTSPKNILKQYFELSTLFFKYFAIIAFFRKTLSVLYNIFKLVYKLLKKFYSNE